MSIGVCLVGRNDDHGGDFQTKISLCINNFLEYYDEIMIVDWISPGQGLIDCVKNKLSHQKKLKYITLEYEDIQKFNLPKGIDYHDYLARNVALRLIDTDWKLVSNLDIISEGPPSDYINQPDTFTIGLRRNVADWKKYIVERNNLQYMDLQSMIHDSPSFIRCIKTLDSNGNPTWDPGDFWSLVISCGDYQLAHRSVWEHDKVRGFEESMLYWGYGDSNIQKKVALAGFKFRVDEELYYFHMDHISSLGKIRLNSQYDYVQVFKETTNGPNWGLWDYKDELLSRIQVL